MADEGAAVLQPQTDMVEGECLAGCAEIKPVFQRSIFEGGTFALVASTIADEFGAEDCLKGALWAPDGTCVLTSCEDRSLRLFNAPEALFSPESAHSVPHLGAALASAVQTKESEITYDFAWYPRMTSSDPATACFASCSKDQPVHLWDAFDGSLRASYRAYNHADEITSVNAIAFSPSGDRLYCGSERMIRVFDTGLPGRDCREFPVSKKRKPGEITQRGILSTLSFGSNPNEFACGSYSGCVTLHDARTCEPVFAWQGPSGVTQVKVAHSNTHLLIGYRTHPNIDCLDVRMPSEPLFSCTRVANTNQRIRFDLTSSDDILVSGSTDGSVRVYDLSLSGECINTSVVCPDAINGVSLHPCLPVIAVSTGERKFPQEDGVGFMTASGQTRDESHNIVAMLTPVTK